MTPSLLIIFLLNAASPTPLADAAFADAKAARIALKADPEKKKFRHHWQNVARKLEAAAARYGRGAHAAEALMLASQTYEELAKFSANKEDIEAAQRDEKKAKELGAFDPSEKAAAKSKDGAAEKGAAKAKDSTSSDKSDRSAAKAKDSASSDKSEKTATKSKDGASSDKSEKTAAKSRDAEASEKPDRVTMRSKDADASDKVASKPKDAAAAEKVGRSGVKIADAPAERPSSRSKDLLASAPTPKQAAIAPSRVDAQVGRIADAFRKFQLPEVEGRRAPPVHVRPATEEDDTLAVPDEAPDAAGGTLKLPSISEIQERLRDVRVGQREVAALKQANKDGETAGLTLAEQLGLKVKRVIIDAGHGGHDTGAIGKNGTLEKDVALSIAMKLAKRLRAAGLEVLLTRDDDTFVRLEDRTRFANQHKGDLFISVHCNSAVSNQLRGVETYTLNTSSDRYSIRLAARENASTERGVGDLQLILADLATKANTEEGARLAKRVQHEMVTGLKEKNPSVRDLGHKEALFFVLLGAKMPAILVETSFLSNPLEEKLLGSEGYQDDAADAIAEGVHGFLDERSRIAQVD